MRMNQRGQGGVEYAANLGAAGRVPKPRAGEQGGSTRARIARTDKRRQIMIHIGTSAATFLLAVTDSNSADVKGYLHHTYTDTRIAFRSLFEATTYMNKVADALDYPQRGYKIRSWRDAPNPLAGYGDEERSTARYGGDEKRESHDGSEAGVAPGANTQTSDDEYAVLLESKPIFTVTIRIQYRQNASWQGEAQWDGSSTPVRFRSVFELMCLIWEARRTVLQNDLH